MKLLVFSDLHLDSPFVWAGKAAHHRREALRKTLRRILDLAIESAVDAILCGGDLYEHDRVRPETRAFLRSEFERVTPIPIYISPGNHDWYGPESVYAQADWSRNVHIFTEETLQAVQLNEGVTLWGAAHCRPALTQGFLDNFRVNGNGIHLALFHGSETGSFSMFGEGRTNHAPFDGNEIRTTGLTHAFLGHYHRPSDTPLYTYPGNPDPLEFGEDPERGVIFVTIADDGTITRERRRVASTELHDVSIDVTGCSSLQDIRERIVTNLNGRSGIARVMLHGELENDIDLRALDPLEFVGALQMPPVFGKHQIHIAYNLAEIAAETTVRGEFVKSVQSSELVDELKTKVLYTGLRALEGRDDLEVP